MFKISTKKEVLAPQEGSSKYINASGIYDVTINFANIYVNEKGGESVNFNFDYNGEPSVVYGPNYKSNAGKDVEYAMNLYTTLGVIAGMEDGASFEIETETHKVGRDKKPMELDVIQDFNGLEVKVHIQQKFSNWDGNGIREGKVIRAFFDADGTSAEELVSGENQGKRLALVEEKYASNISYEDGITPEDVEAWIKGGRGKGTSPAPKKAAAKTGSIFGKKS